jgi:hypothetical protein
VKERYTITRVDRTIHFYAEDSHTDEDDSSAPVGGDVRNAVDALNSNTWDNIDERYDCVICYPADSSMNIRTGDYESFQIIIHGAEKDLEHLMSYWNAKKIDGEKYRTWRQLRRDGSTRMTWAEYRRVS